VARNARFGVALLALMAGAGGGRAVQAQSMTMMHAQVAKVRATTDSLTTARDQRIAAVNGDDAVPVAVKTSNTTLAATPAPAAKPAAPDSLDPVVESAVADSIQRAREIEVMRETFAYAGGTRDPFASLITKDDSGIEIGNLDLVGVYLDLRTPSNNVIVLREKKTSAKRHKMRVGDQLGRARLTQIRARDAVFMIQDFGFERQETLSLRKQEVETP
jgi:hypothetical protein